MPTKERSPAYKKSVAGGHARGFPDGQKAADPDGFAVFGRYPKGFLKHVIRLQLLGGIQRDDIRSHVSADATTLVSLPAGAREGA